MDLGLTYTKIGDYYYPNIALLDTTKYDIGYYGRKHERYLKEHRPSVWARLVLTEELNRHLFEIDTACNEQMEYLVKEIAKREGVTEALKAADPMTWVGSLKRSSQGGSPKKGTTIRAPNSGSKKRIARSISQSQRLNHL